VTFAKSVYEKLQSPATSAKKIYTAVKSTKKKTETATIFSAASKLSRKSKIPNQNKIAREISQTINSLKTFS
jgi:hypothetical protein